MMEATIKLSLVMRKYVFFFNLCFWNSREHKALSLLLYLMNLLLLRRCAVMNKSTRSNASFLCCGIIIKRHVAIRKLDFLMADTPSSNAFLQHICPWNLLHLIYHINVAMLCEGEWNHSYSARMRVSPEWCKYLYRHTSSG